MIRHSAKVNISGTDLYATKLGLGTAPIGGLFTSVRERDSDELINSAFEFGLNFFDTAPQYGHGTAEVRLGRILNLINKPYILETKVGRVLNPTESANTAWFVDANPHLEPVFDFSAEGIKRSLEESLDRLGVDHIDIALLHDAENHLDIAINEGFPILDEYRRQGVIKGIGVGMNYCAPSIRILTECDLNLVLIAGRYTLLDQEAQEALFPLAIKKKVSILAAGVFNSGVLANPNPGSTFDYLPANDEIINRARAIGNFLKERNVSLTAAALQFPLRHPAVTMVLTGSRSKFELESNIKEFNTNLPATIWEELEEFGLIRPLKDS